MRRRIRNILLEATAFTDRPNINEAFWEWFGNSKMVDESGNPLVMYHGTNKIFKSFKVSPRTGLSFFTNSPRFADGFPEGTRFSNINDPKAIHKQIIPVYLSIQNPWSAHDDVAYNKVKEIALQKYKGYKMGDPEEFDWRIREMSRSWLYIEDFLIPIIKQQGFDGVILSEGIETYAIFKPTQAKSIFNQGTWNPNNPDIMK